MKRLVVMLITMAMTVSAVTAAEAKQPQRTQRTVQGSYGPYPAPVTGCNEVLGSWACMIVKTRPAERFITVKVTDTHGLPVYFSIFSPATGFRAEFCGETKKPVALGHSRHLEIEVGVSRWVAQSGCPARSVKTAGTIRVTLSNQR